MTATETMAIIARQTGTELKNEWQQPWPHSSIKGPGGGHVTILKDRRTFSNFTEADVQEMCTDDQGRPLPNYQQCVDERRSREGYEGTGKFLDRPFVQTGINFLSDLFGQNGAPQYVPGYGYNQPYQPDFAPPRRRSNTALWVGLGVVAAVGVGLLIYRQTKK